MIALAIVVVLAQSASCIGYGLALIRLLNVLENQRHGEIIAFSFAIGMGVIG